MNIIHNKDRRYSHYNFSNFLQKYQSPILENKNANKIRTNLLLFSNNEFNEYKKKDKSKVNHLCIIDTEKKFYKVISIKLKHEIYSKYNIILRGEGSSCSSILEKQETFIMQPEYSPDKIYGKVFKRKSLAERKILRFHNLINNEKDLNSSSFNEDSVLLSSSSSCFFSPKHLNHSKLNSGISYLKGLAFSLKDIKLRKRRNSLFYNKRKGINEMFFSLVRLQKKGKKM